MRQLLFIAALAAAATAALHGVPVTAEPPALSIGAEAARLNQQVKAAQSEAARRPALKPAALDAALVQDLQIFGMNASRMALDISARGGPQDLGCIFRGMAEETDVQLGAAASAVNGTQQAAALDRLSRMLRDAEEIAPAAVKAIAASPKGPAATATCPAVKSF
jgi:hypothetical protein